jgi:hypothetical protein
MAPTIYVTPDLGWPSRAAMLDYSTNPAVGSFPIDTLPTTSDPDLPVKDRNTLVFEYEGVKYKLPAGSMSKIGGWGRCFWSGPDEVIKQFTLENRLPAKAADPVKRTGPRMV